MKYPDNKNGDEEFLGFSEETVRRTPKEVEIDVVIPQDLDAENLTFEDNEANVTLNSKDSGVSGSDNASTTSQSLGNVSSSNDVGSSSNVNADSSKSSSSDNQVTPSSASRADSNASSNEKSNDTIPNNDGGSSPRGNGEKVPNNREENKNNHGGKRPNEDEKNKDKVPNEKNNKGNNEKPDKKENKNNPNNRDKKDKSENKTGNQNDKNSNNQKKAEPKRSKNMNDAKQRSGGSLKDRAKNGIKNAPNKIKNSAVNAAKNSEIGQKAQSLKNKYDTAKKIGKAASKVSKTIIRKIFTFIASNPYVLIIAGVVAAFALVLLVIIVAVSPGAGGDVNDDYNYSRFSEVDQNTLDKIRKQFNNYPNADAALAMVTVLYPYYETLHGGNVTSVLLSSKTDTTEDTNPEIPEVSEPDDDKENLNDSEEDTASDDPYLLLFRRYTIRSKLKRLLKEANNGEEAYNNYLKNTYFKNDKGYGGFEEDGTNGFNGYKEMFDSVEAKYHDELANAIITDLYDKKDLFIDYVFERMACSSSSTSLGHSDANQIIKGSPVVVLKDTSATDYASIKSAPALYGTDDLSLNLKRYILGVAYSEIGANVKNEAAAKAEMITAQSFLLGRTHPGSGTGVGMNFTPDYNDTQTIFYIRGNTYDQDFCDVYEGCEAGSKYSKSLISNDPTGEAHQNVKGKLDDASVKQLEIWYDEIANKFIYDDNNKMFYGVQFSDYNNICKLGSCLAQKTAISLSENGSDYNDILFGNKGAFTESRFVLYDSSEGALAKVSTDCVALTGEGSCTVPNDKFIYYSQKVGEFSGKTFCGRTDATIKSSGCGITSMAMVIANLANEGVNPDVTNSEAQAGGYCGEGIGGTSAGYFKNAADKYGLSYSSGTKTADMDIAKAAEQINNTLRSGGLVIINVNKNWLNGGRGHYIVAKGIDSAGRLIIADPYADRVDNPKRNYLSANEIIKNYVDVGFGWYLFTSEKSKEITTNYCTTVITSGDGVTTGYLKDPITPSNTNEQTRASLNDNSQSLYYLSGKYHGGTDFPVPLGTPVKAMDGGVVTATGFQPFGFGYHVVIEHTINDKSYWSVYGHLNHIDVKANQKVSQSQVIGLSGNTGKSSGPHLHVGLTTNRFRLGNSGKGYQYLVLKYIGTNVSYANQPTD